MIRATGDRVEYRGRKIGAYCLRSVSVVLRKNAAVDGGSFLLSGLRTGTFFFGRGEIEGRIGDAGGGRVGF